MSCFPKYNVLITFKILSLMLYILTSKHLLAHAFAWSKTNTDLEKGRERVGERERDRQREREKYANVEKRIDKRINY